MWRCEACVGDDPAEVTDHAEARGPGPGGGLWGVMDPEGTLVFIPGGSEAQESPLSWAGWGGVRGWSGLHFEKMVLGDRCGQTRAPKRVGLIQENRAPSACRARAPSTGCRGPFCPTVRMWVGRSEARALMPEKVCFPAHCPSVYLVRRGRAAERSLVEGEPLAPGPMVALTLLWEPCV